MGDMPGCTGFAAGAVPWCPPSIKIVNRQPPPILIQRQPVQQYPVANNAMAMPQMGGQGVISTPEGGGGYSWFANPPGAQQQGEVTASQFNLHLTADVSGL
jgi:hypothetical protein